MYTLPRTPSASVSALIDLARSWVGVVRTLPPGRAYGADGRGWSARRPRRLGEAELRAILDGPYVRAL